MLVVFSRLENSISALLILAYFSVYEIYNLGNDISEKSISKEEANAKAIDKMIKTKMVSKELIYELIDQGKIEKSTYLQNVLNK